MTEDANDKSDAKEDSERRFTRLDVSFITRLKSTQVNTQIIRKVNNHITNISMGGAFIECPEPPLMDSIIDLSFCLPHSSKEIDVKGIVRWRNVTKQPYGVGVEFIRFELSNRNNLRNFFKQLLTAKLENVPALVEWLNEKDPLLCKSARTTLLEISGGEDFGIDGAKWLKWYQQQTMGDQH